MMLSDYERQLLLMELRRIERGYIREITPEKQERAREILQLLGVPTAMKSFLLCPR